MLDVVKPAAVRLTAPALNAWLPRRCQESRLLRLHQDRKRRIESFVSGLVAQAAGDEQQLHNDDEQEEARSQRSSGSGGARVHHSAGGGGGRGARQQQPLHEVMDERAQERKARRDALKER